MEKTIEECVLKFDRLSPAAQDEIRKGLEAVGNLSATMATWALALLVASVLAVVGTSYFRPPKLSIRLLYLIFLPGWVLLTASVYFSNQISRRYLAMLLVDVRQTICIGESMSHDFGRQLNLFNGALVCAAIWLIGYLLWWIFSTEVELKAKESK